MARRSKTGERVFTVAFMAIVTFVCIAAVAAIHLASADTVTRNAAVFLKQGILSATGRELPERTADVLAWYDANVTAMPNEDAPTYYVIREAGEITAYVFPRAGVGLWGAIKGVVGMTPDLTAFTGASFTDQNETPGLGARITEPWFCRQLAGRGGGLSLVPEPDEPGNPESWSGAPDELHAITGATITSLGVRDMLNVLAEAAPALVKGN